jgi:type I restriction enzyme R subunit
LIISRNPQSYAKIPHITNKGGVLAPQPEQQARGNIDVLLKAAGWHVYDAAAANIHAARGVAIREFPLKSGHGFAAYLLYVRIADRLVTC